MVADLQRLSRLRSVSLTVLLHSPETPTPCTRKRLRLSTVPGAHRLRVCHRSTNLDAFSSKLPRAGATMAPWNSWISLRSVYTDPTMRMVAALLHLHSLQQREEQSAQDLLTEIEQIEEDILPMTEDEREAWILLLALKPSIRTAVLIQCKQISTREQIMASASLAEYAETLEAATLQRQLHQQRMGKAPTCRSRRRHRRRPDGPLQIRGFEETATSIQPPWFNAPTNPPECFVCGEIGHYSFHHGR